MRSVYIFIPRANLEAAFSLLDGRFHRDLHNNSLWVDRNDEDPGLYISVSPSVDAEPENIESAVDRLGERYSLVITADVSGRVNGYKEVIGLLNCVLPIFGGVVQDDNSAYSWTLSEILEGKQVDGLRFFGS